MFGFTRGEQAVALVLIFAIAIGGAISVARRLSAAREERSGPPELTRRSVSLMASEEPAPEYDDDTVSFEISGEVLSPGSYRVRRGTRLFEVVKLIGVSERADLGRINLVRPVGDGDSIIVPREGEGAQVEVGPEERIPQSEGGSLGVVDIATATVEELMKLPRIGRVMAERIVEHREKYGFSSKEDLKKVPGIGEKTYDQIEGLIVLSSKVEPSKIESKPSAPAPGGGEVKSKVPASVESGVKRAPAPGEDKVKLVNINTATLEELMTLPRIGRVIGQRIIDYRREHGGFRTLEELMEVPGIGEKTFEKLKGLITIE
ncbi:MAG: helix-hairpin-helix domain-containing protein [bacterium]